MAKAAVERAVPVLVAYDIPGRDCAQYSAGGALNEADYEAWIDGFAKGIGNQQAVVILEPDALGKMPSAQPSWPTTTSAEALFGQLWGVDDPAAGAWFQQQAIQLAQDASPALPLP